MLNSWAYKVAATVARATLVNITVPDEQINTTRPLFPTESIQNGGLRDGQVKMLGTGRIASSLLKLF